MCVCVCPPYIRYYVSHPPFSPKQAIKVTSRRVNAIVCIYIYIYIHTYIYIYIYMYVCVCVCVPSPC